mmetsp:Transcript_19561/g.67123  ORF Transcript_19561/g.67123 Transcript_19561/m.67123 type:complete len:280 (-) Transcript_19561:151-990(-)
MTSRGSLPPKSSKTTPPATTTSSFSLTSSSTTISSTLQTMRRRIRAGGERGCGQTSARRSPRTASTPPTSLASSTTTPCRPSSAPRSRDRRRSRPRKWRGAPGSRGTRASRTTSASTSGKRLGIIKMIRIAAGSSRLRTSSRRKVEKGKRPLLDDDDALVGEVEFLGHGLLEKRQYILPTRLLCDEDVRRTARIDEGAERRREQVVRRRIVPDVGGEDEFGLLRSAERGRPVDVAPLERGEIDGAFEEIAVRLRDALGVFERGGGAVGEDCAFGARAQR